MALTDRQKLEIAIHFGLCRWVHPVGGEPYVFWHADRITAAFDHIESAATAPLLERIAHLEATESANYGRGQADAHSMLSERIAELEQQRSEARKDAQIIRNQALEDAAKVCAQRAGVFHFESPHNFECNSLAAAIRAMKKEQP